MNKSSEQLIGQNKKVYNDIAPFFSATRQYLWDDLKPLAKYTRDGNKVLDLGCGSGRLYQLFSNLSIDYVGVDQSEEQIKIAQKKFSNNKYVIAEMTSLPFEDNEFDIIYCIATFHHLPDEESRIKALEEMNRVLKPGGYVIMTNWNLFSKNAQKNVKSGKWEGRSGKGDFMVPWLSPDGEVLGKRYYHGFNLGELKSLFKKTDLILEDQYYSHKGVCGSVDESGNIVSILHSSK